LRVEVAGGAEGIEVSADAAALQQALLNLVDNALKHAPAGSAVEVRLERGTDPRLPVRMSVRDSGPGIPSEDHQRIFERFYRRGSELRRETQGVGLGLAIVRHVVEGHGGRVWVESEPGRGAVFFVELPVDGREAKS
jgi:two-component system phosphate regulon sensor histidine kinase PhoR